MSDTPERVNDNFDEIARVDIDTAPWHPSPLAGVERKMLDRVGGEVARATSIVRFYPGYSFSAHSHGGGEEYFVLSGVFSDESGDYGEGYYVRNPPGSRHKPHSDQGCEIFVKLCQMKAAGEPAISVDSSKLEFEPIEDCAGLLRKVLFNAEGWVELVAIERLEAKAGYRETFLQGAEILLLSGELSVDGAALSAPGWVRFPEGAAPRVEAVAPSLYWIKRGVEYPSL